MSAARDAHGCFARDGQVLVSKVLDRLGKDRCAINMVNDGTTAVIGYTTPEGARGTYKIRVSRPAFSEVVRTAVA